jgi:hypothetical protein
VAAGLSLLRSIPSIVNTNALIDQTAANLGSAATLRRAAYPASAR